MSGAKQKVAFVDFDGTSIDNAPISHACFCEMLKSQGVKPISLERYREICDMTNKHKFLWKAGFSAWKIAMLALSSSRRESMADVYRKHYVAAMREVPLREGVREGLAELREQGVDLVMWSNAPGEILRPQAKRLKIEEYLSDILCTEEGNKGPKSAWLLPYIVNNGIRLKNVVTIGDTTEEPLTAREIGAWSIAITGGYASPERLAASRPHHTVDSWHEIPRIVQGLLNNGGPR